MQLEQIEHLGLWKRLKETAPPDSVANVCRMINDAVALLDRVIETFPTYTLHDSRHALNVACLIGDLLGEKGLAKLRPLETVMLLLSAYYHDIGMVFRPEERDQLTKDPEWPSFLEAHPEALVAVHESAQLPVEIAESYCRWRHADRVFTRLNSLPLGTLQWGAVSFQNDLGALCRSHNSDAKELLALETEYLGECDLRFCSILLRLADILDFDSSRAPEMVYCYLGLAVGESHRDKRSATEWRKHLASNGFKFPSNRHPAYQITFAAGPDDPAVEHDLRAFLDVIESEFAKCAAVLGSCCPLWRDHPLPGRVNRQGVKSKGYCFGEYRFQLDQREVINLLMGENLYADPYVFIRELIQNAIDTSRHREFVERARGNIGFTVDPISVSAWDDAEGHHWVRVDDYGMGMNEHIIREYLLRVGRCYYASAEFKAALIRVQKTGLPYFMPISRFGIGLLSCFLAGDRIEILTVHQTEAGKRDSPVRLSLNGIHGFYTLQVPPLAFTPMPRSPDTTDPQENREFGTSVSVRLDPRKESRKFDLRTEIEKHVFCSPVPVVVNGIRMGRDSAVLPDDPRTRKRRVRISRKAIAEIQEALVYKFIEPIVIEFAPLNLTRHAPVPELKGQLWTARLVTTKDWRRLKSEPDMLGCNGRVAFDLDGELKLEITAEVSIDSEPENAKRAFIRRIAKHVIERGRKDTWHYGWGKYRVITDVDLTPLATRITGSAFKRVTGPHPQWMVHNGVVVPTELLVPQLGDISTRRDRVLWFRDEANGTPCAIWGVVSLSDSLRPNVSVSRNLLRDLPIRVYSALTLAMVRAQKGSACPFTHPGDLLDQYLSPGATLLGPLSEDPLIAGNDGWQCEPIIGTDKGYLSVRQIRELADAGKIVSIELENLGTGLDSSKWHGGFVNYCASALVRLGLNVELRKKSFWKDQLVAVPGNPLPLLQGENLFPPLTFVPIPGTKHVRAGGSVLMNRNHCFSHWLIANAQQIHGRYPGVLHSLREYLFSDKRETACAGINANLKRLALLHPDVRPPQDIFLTLKDFPK